MRLYVLYFNENEDTYTIAIAEDNTVENGVLISGLLGSDSFV